MIRLEWIEIVFHGQFICELTPLSTQIIHSKSVEFDRYLWCLSQTPQIFSKHDLSCILSLPLCICVFIFVFLSFSHLLLSSQRDVQRSWSLEKIWSEMIMTTLTATPCCDLVKSEIWTCMRKYASTQIQTRSQRHSDAVHFCPKSNGKSKSNKYAICDFHPWSRRNSWKDVVVFRGCS